MALLPDCLPAITTAAEVNRSGNAVAAPGKGNRPKNDSLRVARSKHWIKVKNRKHPAMERVMDSFR